MKKNESNNTKSLLDGDDCPAGKYWVKPHVRKRVTKDGRVYIQNVKGYCCTAHCLYQTIADEEGMTLDHLYFALTLYGEARGENETSKRAIAWVIQNRFIKKMGGDTYQKIVLRKNQFSCWRISDPNHEKFKKSG